MQTHHRHSRKQGLTLIEILVVTVIVALLVALVVGVSRNAIQSAKETSAINQGRQIVTALSLYRESHDSLLPPRSLDSLVDASLLPASILVVPSDPYAKKLGSMLAETCYGDSMKHPQSFETYNNFSNMTMQLRFMESIDPNPGILALRVFIKKSFYPENNCIIQGDLQGRFIRFRIDGSVSRPTFAPFEIRQDGYATCVYHLFVDPKGTGCFEGFPRPEPET